MDKVNMSTRKVIALSATTPKPAIAYSLTSGLLNSLPNLVFSYNNSRPRIQQNTTNAHSNMASPQFRNGSSVSEIIHSLSCSTYLSLLLPFWLSALDRGIYYTRLSSMFQDATQSWSPLCKRDIFPTYSIPKSFIHSPVPFFDDMRMTVSPPNELLEPHMAFSTMDKERLCAFVGFITQFHFSPTERTGCQIAFTSASSPYGNGILLGSHAFDGVATRPALDPPISDFSVRRHITRYALILSASRTFAIYHINLSHNPFPLLAVLFSLICTTRIFLRRYPATVRVVTSAVTRLRIWSAVNTSPTRNMVTALSTRSAVLTPAKLPPPMI